MYELATFVHVGDRLAQDKLQLYSLPGTLASHILTCTDVLQLHWNPALPLTSKQRRLHVLSFYVVLQFLQTETKMFEMNDIIHPKPTCSHLYHVHNTVENITTNARAYLLHLEKYQQKMSAKVNLVLSQSQLGTCW